MELHFSVRNATRSATAWAASPVGLMVRVEVLVTVSCALLATLVFLGSGRRTSRSAAFRAVVWLALMLSYPAVSYTIGLMQSGSFGNDLVVVWACFLLSCADGIAACSVDGSEKQARTILLNQAAQVVTVLLLLLSYVNSLHPQLRILLLLLWLLNIAKLGIRLQSLLSIGRDRVLTADNWLISKYMGREDVSNIWSFDPDTMAGYKYMVAGEEDVHSKAPSNKAPEEDDDVEKEPRKVTKDDDLVTIDMVWQCKGTLLSGKDERRSGKLKDLCLSFALFKLLRRRLDESPLHEADDIRTLVFVRRGLASGKDHKRMYRVIEVELGFLYDYFYARYPSPKQTLVPETAMFVAAVALSLSTLFSPALLHYQHPRLSDTNTNFIVTTGLDIWLARLVIVLFLILELFQYLSLVLSDWHKVKVLCRYVREESWKGWKVMEMLLGLMFRATLTRRYWSNSVGQYSLLHACHENERSWLLGLPLHRRIKELIVQTRRVKRPSLPVVVKRAIHELLRSEWLSNIKYGDRTLQKHNKLQDFDWSTSRYQHGALGSILIWHIATTIFDDADTTPKQDCGDTHREVATTLSKYCAYLLFRAPELVTDQIHDQRRLMEALQRRIQKEYRADYRSSKDKAEEATSMVADEESGYEGDILSDGKRLAALIPAKIPKEAERWEMLAEIWVELLLTVAPSGKVTDHVKKLATGGELITHLWALLMHGGMIQMPTKPYYGP